MISKGKIKGILRDKQVWIQCIFVIIIAVMGTYRLRELTMPIILDDEFGYWSNSALFMGQDWSDLTSRISYYSYGYSLILCVVKMIAHLLDYTWYDTYQLAVVFNVAFVAAGYLLSVKVANRYMKHLNRLMIPVVCFVVAIYPSSMLYTHVTLTECELTFLFWLMAYLMMHLIDRPSIANHVGIAAITVYMYAVHQRTIGLIIAVVLVVCVLRILRINSIRQTAAFLGTLYGCYVSHLVVKKSLQNVNYLGNPPKAISEILPEVFTRATVMLLVAIVAVMIWLYLLEKGKMKLCLALFVGGIASVVAVILTAGHQTAQAEVELRLSVNELSGQIGVLKSLFTPNGLIRLATSIIGKWYYLAAATGLVICWGLWDLLVNALRMILDGCKRLMCALKGKDHIVSEKLSEDYQAHIFYLGMFLTFASAFMICALYKEGLYKVDDLINGRYIEYLIGFVLIYSVDRLLADQHWIGFWTLFCIAFVIAGEYCQYVFEQLQRTEYELIHAVVFGRVFWNYEVPVGKIRIVARYVIPLSLGFTMIVKAYSSKSNNRSSMIWNVRLAVALLLPLLTWNHIYTEIVDHYVVARNEKQSGAAPHVAEWITKLSNGGPVYFVTDELTYRQAEIIQYMSMDEQLVVADFAETDFTKDAIFILNRNQIDDDIVKETCDFVGTWGSYAVVVNKDQTIMQLWQKYKDRSAARQMQYLEEKTYK